MNILEEIVQYKKTVVDSNKEMFPLAFLSKSKYYTTSCVSMVHYLTQKKTNGIIAEFKRKSPSQGWIQQYANVGLTSVGYMQAGASALSILTDERFFGAVKEDISTARDLNYCPILRKEFIIDPYQIYESKSLGADVILLIAKVLTRQQVIEYTQIAHDLGLEVLLEIQNEAEAKAYANTNCDMVGVNNRNLADFNVQFDNSIQLLQYIPDDKVKIAESGIQSVEDVKLLRHEGFQGFLIGTRFMKLHDPALACKQFIKSL